MEQELIDFKASIFIKVFQDEYSHNELSKDLDKYAKLYHEAKFKLLALANVSQQRELLLAFAKNYNRYLKAADEIYENDIDDFLKLNNYS